MARPNPWSDASVNLRWVSAVVQAGLLLRDSEHKGRASWGRLLDRACGAEVLRNLLVESL